MFNQNVTFDVDRMRHLMLQSQLFGSIRSQATGNNAHFDKSGSGGRSEAAANFFCFAFLPGNTFEMENRKPLTPQQFALAVTGINLVMFALGIIVGLRLAP